MTVASAPIAEEKAVWLEGGGGGILVQGRPWWPQLPRC